MESLRRKKNNAPTRDRTEDLSVNSRTLCQLSHGGTSMHLNFFDKKINEIFRIIFIRWKSIIITIVPVAQRIRHLTTNQGIVGSNPTGDVLFFWILLDEKNYVEKHSRGEGGIEPPTSRTRSENHPTRPPAQGHVQMLRHLRTKKKHLLWGSNPRPLA